MATQMKEGGSGDTEGENDTTSGVVDVRGGWIDDRVDDRPIRHLNKRTNVECK